MKMKTIPCTVFFDKTRSPIGTLSIDERKLPKGADYVFAIGGIVKEKVGNKITKFELLEISLVPDRNYKKYLEKMAD